MATPQALRRIGRELADINAQRSPLYTAGPKSDSDILNWDVSILGPGGTPYEGGTFKLSLTLPPSYPFHPPTLSFITKIYHPNVLPDGMVCIPLLKTDQWKPACKLVTVIEIAVGLLKEPDEDQAIEGDAAEVYKADRKKYEKTAREWTKKYAK
ncbi:ubiquitin-conjugating enzyme/RWD-like protein [Lipomyces chichibuensis]|uniref:ubiquitin-conjugating enzyme/RWD-like protein n=1 Tax=Lipomyces chichibuensis TaxID=1546026 RepID=UPI003344086E